MMEKVNGNHLIDSLRYQSAGYQAKRQRQEDRICTVILVAAFLYFGQGLIVWYLQ